MSIIMMLRKCKYCKHKYAYNPSTGDFGLICPKCKKVQTCSGPLSTQKGKIKL